jgi:cytochrome c-type biogenesis protein
MSLPITEISNPFVAAFAVGLFYGLTVCTASCLPYVASYIAGVNAGFGRGLKITMFFNGGRIVAYAIIGAIVGLFAELLHLSVPDQALSPFQIYFAVAFGIATIVIGVNVLWRANKRCECPQSPSVVKAGRGGFDFGAFSLGLTRGLVLCPPLIALLGLSLPFSTPVGSVGLAVLFGLGTIISPILFLGGVTGWLLNKAPLFRKWISLAGGVILITLGVITIVNAIIQI